MLGTNKLMRGKSGVKGSGAEHHAVRDYKVKNSQSELNQVHRQWFSPCAPMQLKATSDSTQTWTQYPTTSLNTLSRWWVRHEHKYVVIVIEQIKIYKPLNAINVSVALSKVSIMIVPLMWELYHALNECKEQRELFTGEFHREFGFIWKLHGPFE